MDVLLSKTLAISDLRNSQPTILLSKLILCPIINSTLFKASVKKDKTSFNGNPFL